MSGITLVWLILFAVTMALWLATARASTRLTVHPSVVFLLPFLAVLFGVLFAASVHTGIGCSPGGPFMPGRGC